MASFIFIIYKLSPIKHPRVKLVLFADDTNIFVADKNEDPLQHKILHVMKELQIWFKKKILL